MLVCVIIYIVCRYPISMDMACHKALSAVACSFEFTNINRGDYYLSKRNTPLEGFLSPFVAVSRDGVPLDYKGIYVSRAPATKDEFVLLKQGQSISATVQLNEAFTFSYDGLYNIRYTQPLEFLSKEEMEVKSAGYDTTQQVKLSESVYMYLEGTDQLFHPAVQEELDTGGHETVSIEGCNTVEFEGGSSKQRNTTLDVHNKICLAGLSNTMQKIGDNALYKKWFGTYTESNAETVKNNYLKVFYFLRRDKTVFYQFMGLKGHCSSGKVIGYSADFHISKITLCTPYDDLAKFCTKSATRSKEGEVVGLWLINQIRGLLYLVKGYSESLALAKSDPGKAIQNIPNYIYYYCEAR